MEPKIFWVRGARTGVRIRKEEGLLHYERDIGLCATQSTDYIFLSFR
jgi:hypothetical protein